MDRDSMAGKQVYSRILISLLSLPIFHKQVPLRIRKVETQNTIQFVLLFLFAEVSSKDKISDGSFEILIDY